MFYLKPFHELFYHISVKPFCDSSWNLLFGKPEVLQRINFSHCMVYNLYNDYLFLLSIQSLQSVITITITQLQLLQSMTFIPEFDPQHWVAVRKPSTKISFGVV